MDNITIVKVLEKLEEYYEKWEKPIVTEVAEETGSVFKILISTVLSSRTKDEVTGKASARLFEVADTPEKMKDMDPERIENIIYPVGFYRVKAERIPKIAGILLEKFDGNVPDTLEELLTLPGVGRKTANLVLTLGFGKPGICVDTHVHRISNRFGYVDTENPQQTEFALRDKLPGEWWIRYNDLLVTLGQNICHPRNPDCNNCPVESFCEQIT